MAIVIEEEVNRISITKIITWLVVLLVIIIAIYYIFFAQPQIIEVAIPPTFQNINPLANVNLNPDEIASVLDKSLKAYVTVPQPGNAGRANPFLPF